MNRKSHWNASTIKLPPKTIKREGRQILHFSSGDKPYHLNQVSQKFVEDHLSKAQAFEADAEVLRFASDQVRLDGQFLEMGVCTGFSINFIAALNPRHMIHGFDSFEGLPEDWVRGDVIIEKGTFGFLSDQMFPPTLHNVTLYKGWFKNTLPTFIKEHKEPTHGC